ncbi:MAG TPA: hypothetical protein VED41_02480, partial [Solirubrobacteraceae bacterium]|nr:hypothetical protein [Solirubrobacteraceae bacterium]
VDAGARRPPRADLLLLASMLVAIAHEPSDGVPGAGEHDMFALLGDLEFAAGDRDLAIYEAISAPAAAARLAAAHTPSQIHAAVSHVSPEGVALAGAWARAHDGDGHAERAAREWLGGLNTVTLEITGDDLLAAGVPEGPEIGRRLDAALLRKLDGELGGCGREAELKAALGASV